MSSHEQTIRAAAAHYQDTEAAHDEARAALVAAVVGALEAGERPTDVTTWSPFTAAYIRKLARTNGIEAARRASE
jgi:hypothetical protein